MKGLIKIDNLITYIISIILSILSILIAYMAFKRNKDKDNLKEAIDTGILLSDIGYIKKSLDRIEKRLEHVEINYNDLLKRRQVKEILDTGAFSKIVLLKSSMTPGKIEGIYDAAEVRDEIYRSSFIMDSIYADRSENFIIA